MKLIMKKFHGNYLWKKIKGTLKGTEIRTCLEIMHMHHDIRNYRLFGDF